MTVIGSYPCCDGPLMIDEGPPPWPKIVFAFCEHCGTKVVHKLSKIDPMSWLENDFPDWDSIQDQDGTPVGRGDVEWVHLR